jgi:tripeptide aminopeptidase
MDTVTERFLRYVKIDTESAENDSFPTTEKQFDLARLLYNELNEMGASHVRLDEKYCYVYAEIPSNLPPESEAPSIGFIAHMDTSSAVSGKDVKPRIAVYDGADIALDADGKYILSAKDFPELNKLRGRELIVTDGSTLLGADDKAGVAEIMAMAAELLAKPDIRHGKVCIGFTPDEEVGKGVANFDIEGFGADFAYTVDGGPIGGLEYENFNAASAKITVRGRSIHPGSAKGRMLNAVLMAQEFQSLLPVFENPMYTEGYEGFYHLMSIQGDVELCRMSYIIRDHDREKFEAKKANIIRIAEFLNGKYGAGSFSAEITDSYYNMKEAIRPHMHIIDTAIAAMTALGIKPHVSPIRGGTDGAMLSFKGLPCPNLCTGGYNCHGRYEFIPVCALEAVTRLLVEIVKKYAG